MIWRTRIPEFQLEKVYADGRLEEPELHRLYGLDPSCRMGRRGFLLTSALGAGTLAALAPSGRARGAEGPSAIPAVRVEIADGLAAHYETVRTLAFHPDGSLLASADDKAIKFWSLPEGKLSHTLKEHGSIVDSILFTPDGELFVSCSEQIKLWPAPFVAAQTILDIRENYLAVSPDSKFLASASYYNGTVRLLELPSGQILKELKHSGPLTSLAFSPDGGILACGERAQKAVSLWSVPSGKLFARWTDREIAPRSLAFSPDGAWLAACVNDELRLWKMPEGDMYAKLGGQYGTSDCLAFSPDGEWLALGSHGGVLLLRKPFVRPALILQGHTKLISVLAFSKDSRLLAVGMYSGKIFIWEMPGEAPENNPARLRVALLDPEAMHENISVRYGNRADQSVFSGRCGDPLPEGAICTCDCVSGRYSPPPPSGGGATTICTCDRICTCVPVK
ncbi:MAG: WD40 repeat domain-containing protein [Desulfovibrionaceae bacterium]|nr:WD40 repeat domain-containing protein [Desulfovibrionaceae bacterium]